MRSLIVLPGAISVCLLGQKAILLLQKSKEKDKHPKKIGNQLDKFCIWLEQYRKVRRKCQQSANAIKTKIRLSIFFQFTKCATSQRILLH